MPEPWQTAHNRGGQTISVWNEFNPAFKIGQLTLALHTTDVASLLTQSADRDGAKDLWDQAAGIREQAINELDDLNTRVPHVIENNLEEDSTLFNQFAEIYAIQGSGADRVQTRAGKVISLWKLANTERAAQVPPLTPLDLDGTLVADMDAMLTNYPVLTKAANDKKGDWSKKKSVLRMTTDKVDKNNKRWFEAWGNNYKPGTPENDALNNIDTESGGASPVGKAVIDMAMALGGRVIDMHFHADHSTFFTILYRVVGTAAFSVLVADLEEDMFHGTVPIAGALELQVIGNNSEGPGEASDPFPLTVT